METVRHLARSMGPLAVIGWLAAASLSNLALGAEHSEESVKAAYRYRFAGYIGWPDSGSANTPFTIAVLGAPELARELRHVSPDHPITCRGLRKVGST